MKKIVLLHVCLILLSVNFYSQNILNRHKLPYAGINPLRNEKNVYPSPEEDYLSLNMPYQMRPDKNRDAFKLNRVVFNPVLVVIDSIRRENYTYYDNGDLKLRTSQELKNGVWETWRKITVTYHDNGRVRKSFSELWQSAGVVSASSRIDTLDAKGNVLSSVSIENDEILSRDVYTYNDNGKILTMLYQQFQKGLLLSADRTTYTFSEKGEILNTLVEKWTDNAWVNVCKYTSTYDTMGNEITRLMEDWKNGTWVTSFRGTSTYDDKGNPLSYISEFWMNGAVTSTVRGSWANSNNENTRSLLEETLVNGIWVNLSRTTYTYDSDKNNTSYVYEKWTDGSWINSNRHTCIYENGKLLSDVAEEWYNDAWLKTFKQDYKYDNYGNAVKGESFKWALEGETWVPYAGQMLLYYDEGKAFLFLNNAVVEVQYGQFTGVERINTAASGFSLLQNYPNPFNPSTTISYSIPKQSHVEMKIFDMLGREVSTLVKKEQSAGEYKVQFDGSNLPSGMYIYSIQAGEFRSSKKLLMIK
jgi:hypothetical protein